MVEASFNRCFARVPPVVEEVLFWIAAVRPRAEEVKAIRPQRDGKVGEERVVERVGELSIGDLIVVGKARLVPSLRFAC